MQDNADAAFRIPSLSSVSLDSAREAALKAALQGIRARRGIAIVVANRRSLLSIADVEVRLEQGRVARVVETAEMRSRSRAPIDAQPETANPNVPNQSFWS